MKNEILALIDIVKSQIDSRGLSDEDLAKYGILKFRNNLDDNREYIEKYVDASDTAKLAEYREWLIKNSKSLAERGFDLPTIELENAEFEAIMDETEQKLAADVQAELERRNDLGSDDEIYDEPTEALPEDDNHDIMVVDNEVATYDDDDEEEDILRVVHIVPENEQDEDLIEQKNKAIRRRNALIGILGVSTAALLLALALKSCNAHSNRTAFENNSEPVRVESEATLENESETESITVTPTPVETEAVVQAVQALPIDNVDLNNEEELAEYAQTIYNRLGEDAGITIDDIMYAIRLANYEYIDDNNYFLDREGVCRSTYMIGELSNRVGSDYIIKRDPESDIYLSQETMQDIIRCVTNNEVNVNAFAQAKTEQGYDIYRVEEICVRNMNDETLDNLAYGKILNELVTRSVLSFSIVENCPIQTRYAILGIYNANGSRVDEVTSGSLLLGPIYGDTARIDGTYGYICVEELRSATYIDHENGQYIGSDACLFYTLFADDELINQGYSR